jgi:hypothetical protein
MASVTIFDYSALPYLRQVLAPEYAILPSAQIRSRMESTFGEGSADAYNDYLEFSLGDIGRAFSSAARDVGRVATKVAPAVATVGGGALQGALSGAQFGLPGIIAGAAAGGVGAGLSKYGSGTARDIGGALSGVTGLAGQFSPLGRVGAAVGPAISGLAAGGKGGLSGAAVSALSGLLGAGGGGGAGGLGLGAASSGGGGVLGAVGGLLGGGGGATGAAGALQSLFGGSSATGQLVSLLQRPEFAQALGALNLGTLGRKTIPVGSQQVPVPTAAFANLAAQLADQIATDAAEWSGGAESTLSYMMNSEGDYVGDPALDGDRAARVWSLLNEAQAERVLDVLTDFSTTESSEAYANYVAELEAQDQEYYDAMDLMEAYTLTDSESADFEFAEREYD